MRLTECPLDYFLDKRFKMCSKIKFRKPQAHYIQLLMGAPEEWPPIMIRALIKEIYYPLGKKTAENELAIRAHRCQSRKTAGRV